MNDYRAIKPRPNIAYMQRHERRAPDGSTFDVRFECGSCDAVVEQHHRYCPMCGKRFWRKDHVGGPKP